METLYPLCAACIAILGLSYYRASGIVWSLFIALTLFSVDYVSSSISFVGWSLWLLFTMFGAIAPIRTRTITPLILYFFKKALPPMSNTEKEAIEAGDVWWEADLFRGEPDWKKLFNYAATPLTAAEQAFIQTEVVELCNMIDDWDMRKKGDLPSHVWEFIKHKGFFGLIIPPEFGGKGFSATAHSEVISRIASRSGSAAVTVMVPNSLGPAELLLKFGTDEQKKYYLPRLARGEEIPCFALTNPYAGSDAGAIPDKAIVCKGQFEGKEVLGLKVTWEKRYITLAPVATVLGIAFKLYDPEHLLGDTTELGITLALIPTNHPGVQIGKRHMPLSMFFMNGPTHGTDVFIPMHFIIGGQERIGQGWRMLMNCLSEGRGISLPALSTAISQASFKITGAYSRVRQQFNVPIGEFEGIAEALAQIGGMTYMVNSMRTLTASALDKHIKPAVVSAIVKYHMTEMARKCTEHSMDIQAGKAIIMGPKNFIEPLYTSVPVSITVEGANILTRCLIIFGQGAIRCHPYLYDEMMAALSTSPFATGKFDTAFFGHVSYTVSKVAKSLFHGFTRGLFSYAPTGGKLKWYLKQANMMSAALATTADLCLLRLGGNLKRMERVSARIGDALSYLFMFSSVVKHYKDAGSPLDEKIYVQWCAQYTLAKAAQALDEVYDNLGWFGWILKRLSLPIGHGLKKPSDKLDGKIAHSMLAPSALRDKLTDLVFVPSDPQDKMNILEAALINRIQAEAAEKKIRKAVKHGTLQTFDDLQSLWESALSKKIINVTEMEDLKRDRITRENIIAVDEV